jgi:N-acetylmuramic acid 6-phosphate etherase
MVDFRIKKIWMPFLFILFFALVVPYGSLAAHDQDTSQENQKVPEKKANLLRLLDLIPSPLSINYVQEKTQYQLHTLLTEQRHPKTWNLSDRISQDIEAGYQMLFTVDEDVCAKLESFYRENKVLERAVQAVEEAILSGQKIYIFGCQETGRWAKWVESSLWRPFWKNLQARKKIWAKIGPNVHDSIENRLIGEMPGSDNSLISPLEGWEDLMLTGRLQLEERGVEPGDVVFCMSASGETPAVIGTIYEALDLWTKRHPYELEKIQKKLFYFFNNPEELLLSFDRCRVVLTEPGISKIECATGPQAIAGFTRMQAATIDAFLIANILQTALDRTLRRFLSDKEMVKLGFETPVVFAEKLRGFADTLKAVKKIVPSLAKLARLTEKVQRDKWHTTYLALKGSGTVFNDCSELGPAFHICPIDSVKTEPRESPIQFWVAQSNQEDAWRTVLGRPFRGLSPAIYKNRFESEQKGANLDLLRMAWESLEKTGDDQQNLYDFSLSDFNLRNRGAKKGDLGILVVISPEEALLKDKDSYFSKFLSLYLKKGASTAILFITEKSEKEINKIVRKIPGFNPDGKDVLVVLSMNSKDDPMAINRLIALKIILNANSTAVMARTGSIIGNTVPVADPKNLKSIGRATALVLSHVNDVLKKPDWVKRHGIQKPISYGEGNAVLFDTIRFLEDKGEEVDKGFLVALSIIRILESFRLNRPCSYDEALAIIRNLGFQRYLKDVTIQIR